MDSPSRVNFSSTGGGKSLPSRLPPSALEKYKPYNYEPFLVETNYEVLGSKRLAARLVDMEISLDDMYSKGTRPDPCLILKSGTGLTSLSAMPKQFSYQPQYGLIDIPPPQRQRPRPQADYRPRYQYDMHSTPPRICGDLRYCSPDPPPDYGPVHYSRPLRRQPDYTYPCDSGIEYCLRPLEERRRIPRSEIPLLTEEGHFCIWCNKAAAGCEKGFIARCTQVGMSDNRIHSLVHMLRRRGDTYDR